ncbi:MAG: SPFH domain-containing protein [Dorea sp.]|nr:SPFH domain-containing protein [Dorea sp.]
MRLPQAVVGAATGTAADQWKEYFYCDALSADVLVAKGQKRMSGRFANKNAGDNIISDGSVIAVNEGQCMMVVEQGKVVDLCSEAGEYIYDRGTEPSLFCGNLGKSIGEMFDTFGKRFTFGGEAPMDQRIYYFNIKEIVGNKYGTPSPIPFRIVEPNSGLDMDVSLRCFGEYSYKMANPILFYKNVCGNVETVYYREQLQGQLKSEFLTALHPAFSEISRRGIRYSELPGHTLEIAEVLNEVLSEKWMNTRGIEISSIGVSGLRVSEEDEAIIKEMQKKAVYREASMAAASMVDARVESMKAAAANEGAGAVMAFMGMNMAEKAGRAEPLGRAEESCVKEEQKGWVCPECGTPNQRNFCMECGAKRPVAVHRCRCNACGWEPEDPERLPKFCPECGDPFDENDVK